MAQYRLPVQAAQYISQYDPAMEQMQMQVMKDRSNRFEQSYANISDAQAKLEEIFFLDQNTGQQVKDRFAAEKEDILNRYNYDYEAAAPELTKLVVKERSNPVYQLNQYQQQKVQDFQQQLNRIGQENAIVLNSPLDQQGNIKSLYDEKTGRLRNPEEFNYEIYDRSKIQAKGAQWLSQLKPMERGLEVDPTNKAFMRQIKEITPENFNKIVSDESVNKFLESAPELKRIAESQGLDPIQFTRDYLKSQGQGLIGIHDIQYIQNPRYKEDLQNNINAFNRTSQFNDVIKTNIGPYNEILNKYSEYEKDKDKKDGITERSVKMLGTSLAKGLNSLTRGFGLGNVIDLDKEKIADNIENDPEFKKIIDNAVLKHPELENKSLQEKISYIEKLNNSHINELSKISTIDNEKWYSAESDKLLTMDGGIGLLPTTEFTIFSSDKDAPITPIGNNKLPELYKITGTSKPEDLFKVLGKGLTVGWNFTGGEYPGEMVSIVPVSDDRTLTIRSLPNNTDFQQLSAPAWALAHAIRSDNNSNILDRRGYQYGIIKDEKDDSYLIPNTIGIGIQYDKEGNPTLLKELNGKYPAYIKAKNYINSNGNSDYRIELYDSTGEYIDYTNASLEYITKLTEQVLTSQGLINTRQK